MNRNGHNSALIPDPQKEREWFGLRRLSEYGDVSERTLRSWIHSLINPLPACRVGGKILVRRRDFDGWIEQHKIKPFAAEEVDKIVREVVEGVTSGS